MNEMKQPLIYQYTDSILRVRWSPDTIMCEKDFNDDLKIATFIDPNCKLSPTQLSFQEDKISTGCITLLWDAQRGCLSFYDQGGQLILKEKNRTAKEVGKERQSYYKITQEFYSDSKERLYGFGNVNEKLGIRGEEVLLQQGNTTKRTPMFLSNQGYGILMDGTCNGRLEWTKDSYSYTLNYTDSLDYYFIYGPNADQIIEGYRSLTGTAVMLPKGAFGYIQSRNRYESRKKAVETAKTFREKKIPVDMLVIDYLWWDNEFFNNITVTNEAYEDLSLTAEQLHQEEVMAAISIWPSFVKDDKNPTYQEIIKEGEDILLPKGTGFGLPYDATKREFRERYWKMIDTYVYGKGLDSIWLDANEPEMGDFRMDCGEQTAYGSSQSIGLLYPLLDTSIVYEGQRRPPYKKRVNTLSRGAVAGIQRYGIQSWSGDIPSNFNQLKQEIHGVLNFSAAGLPYFSTDTGGYFGINVDDLEVREMFLRWLQFSCFTSIMRVHGRDSIREPWQFGAIYEKYITAYIKLRERFVPYTYSLAGMVTQKGYSIVRPLVFDFREDQTACETQEEFMFGPAFLVAPVTELHQRMKEVYLPKGKWVHFWTGEEVDSNGETVLAKAPLTQIPVYVRAGAIIPMAMDPQHAFESMEELEIRIYEGANGSFCLYEDEGNNYNYETGAFSEILMKWNDKEGLFTISDRVGSFEGMIKKRIFHLVLVKKGYGTGLCHATSDQMTICYDGKEVKILLDRTFVPKQLEPEFLEEVTEEVAEDDFLAKSLVGEWKLHEGEGLGISDSSGNFNHGKLVTTSSTPWSMGHRNQKEACLLCEGGQSKAVTCVIVENHKNLTITDELSFRAYVYPFAESNREQVILSKEGAYRIFLTSEDFLAITLHKKEGSFTEVTKVKVPKEKWTRIFLSCQSKTAKKAGRMLVSFNGELQEQRELTEEFMLNGSLAPLWIGADHTIERANAFVGKLEEIRLFRKALTEKEADCQ